MATSTQIATEFFVLKQKNLADRLGEAHSTASAKSAACNTVPGLQEKLLATS